MSIKYLFFRQQDMLQLRNVHRICKPDEFFLLCLYCLHRNHFRHRVNRLCCYLCLKLSIRLLLVQFALFQLYLPTNVRPLCWRSLFVQWIRLQQQLHMHTDLLASNVCLNQWIEYGMRFFLYEQRIYHSWIHKSVCILRHCIKLYLRLGKPDLASV